MTTACTNCGNRVFACCDALEMDGIAGRGAIAFRVDGARELHLGHVVAGITRRLVCHGGCHLESARSYDIAPYAASSEVDPDGLCAGLQAVIRGGA